MSQDEDVAMTAWKRDSAIMHDLCAESGGRVLKAMGDGMLMYFECAVQAVGCSMRIQQRLSKQAVNLKRNEYLEHRIGIHLGDVLISENDVMGDGVNIAARLQEQAEPGGIVISSTVYDVVKNRVDLQTVYLGARELKNIKETIPIYRILVEAREAMAKNRPGLSAVHSSELAPHLSDTRKTGQEAKRLSSTTSRLVMVSLGILLILASVGYIIIPDSADRPETIDHAPTGTVPIATARRNFKSRYDFAGFVTWLRQHNGNNHQLIARFEALAELRRGCDEILTRTSAQTPIKGRSKGRPISIWKRDDEVIVLRRQREGPTIEKRIEDLTPTEMLALLFHAHKANGSPDSSVRSAMRIFAEEYEQSDPIVQRLRQPKSGRPGRP